MDRNLILEIVQVTETAGLTSAASCGGGDGYAADRTVTQAVYQNLNNILFKGFIVNGIGEK
jgi:fructose-1,6-bisphosphatase/sedoheptulose 1,7-bisphosphatase-like protein